MASRPCRLFPEWMTPSAPSFSCYLSSQCTTPRILLNLLGIFSWWHLWSVTLILWSFFSSYVKDVGFHLQYLHNVKMVTNLWFSARWFSLWRRGLRQSNQSSWNGSDLFAIVLIGWFCTRMRRRVCLVVLTSNHLVAWVSVDVMFVLEFLLTFVFYMKFEYLE